MVSFVGDNFAWPMWCPTILKLFKDSFYDNPCNLLRIAPYISYKSAFMLTDRLQFFSAKHFPSAHNSHSNTRTQLKGNACCRCLMWCCRYFGVDWGCCTMHSLLMLGLIGSLPISVHGGVRHCRHYFSHQCITLRTKCQQNSVSSAST